MFNYLKRRRGVNWYISIVVLVALCVALGAGLLYGWSRGSSAPEPEEDPGAEAIRPLSQEELFDILLDELFVDIVTSDSITLNYFIADPSVYGIGDMTPGYGEVTSPETIQRDRQETRDLLDRLSGFQYDNLRADQQVACDILLHNIELSELLDSEDDYFYYLGAIRPLNGQQVQLPIILAEFNFYTEADIDIYLRLLEDTRRYYDDLIEFERERSRRGFFLSDPNTDKVIEHCESFLENPEDNFMIAVFNDRIDRYEGLDDGRREQLKLRNRELVLGEVLPAYEALLEAMRSLRGQGANPGGLADLPDGGDFARAYFQYKTGSSMTPEQADALLQEEMDRALVEIWALMDSNPKLSEAFANSTLGSIRDDTPENYLDSLRQAIAADFPAIGPLRYVVHEVHDSMQEHVSPAFYLTPAFDRYDDNVIYINPSAISDNMSLFTTLAHEGYPGHMYQTVYYLQQSPHPLRTVLGDWGYTEGWATYVEFQSYHYAGLRQDSAELLRLSGLFDLFFITRIDLGVNALGWDISATASFCRQLGISDYGVVEDVYHTVTGNPLLYLPYCLGYLEFMSLRDEAITALADDFDLNGFHRFLLDFGPAPFPVIREHMQDWIEEFSSGGIAAAA